MEAIISRLLEAFENGQVNRRQLVTSLAVAATGVGAVRPAKANPAAANGANAAKRGASSGGRGTPGGAPFATASLDHISYAVADYGRSRDFYVDLMGWSVQSDNGESQATLQIGDVGNIIVRNRRRPAPPSPSGSGRPPVTGVINHIAWRLESFDADEVREELRRRGLDPRRDQGGGGDYDSYHVLDPDGWDLQISK